MFDYHLHTNYSSDSDADFEEMVKSAVKKNIKEIAITDHMDYDSHEELLDTDNYIKTIDRIKDKYKDRITIIKGVELGLQPHILDWCKDYVNKYNFDFVIGSIHMVQKKDLYWDRFAQGKPKDQCFRQYLSDLYYCVKNSEAYSVIGHFDVIRRYIDDRDKSFPLHDYYDITEEIFKLLVHKGKGIEINTSGIRYKLGNTLPPMEFVKRFRELGGEIITLGSDAHNPNDVGFGLNEAVVMAKECGFKYITSFKGGKPAFIPI